jgi:hypothetical protein
MKIYNNPTPIPSVAKEPNFKAIRSIKSDILYNKHPELAKELVDAFRANYYYFAQMLKNMGGEELSCTVGDAFLVYIPRLEESNWVYRVDAVPKVDIIRLFDLSVRKEWNVSSNSDTPDKVTIELSTYDLTRGRITYRHK